MGSFVSLNVYTEGWAYHSIIFESDFLNTVSSTAVRSSPFGPFWKRLMKLCACAQREGKGTVREACCCCREREERKFDRPPRPRSLEEDGKRADAVLLYGIEHDLHDLRE